MNVALVLGAGASLANAQHFHAERMRETWPPLDTTFFEAVERRGIALSPALRRYFQRIVGIEPTWTTLRELRMEEVFKDAFFDLDDSPGNRIVLNGYIDLVDLYLRVLRETTNWLGRDDRRGAPVGRLLAEAARVADHLTVITFNHDLVIENEIAKRAHLRSRWCLDQGYGSLSAGLTVTRPTGGRSPVFSLHRDAVCDHDRPITILKLHGSLNWVVRLTSARPTANFLRGRAGPRPVHLISRREIADRETIVRTGHGRTTWQTWPVVVPPVYAKQALRSAVQATWTDARDALLRADRVVFFGYSLPPVDIESEKLFERALGKSNAAWLDVINPSHVSAGRFAEVGKGVPVRWYPSTENFFDAGGLAPRR